MLRAIYKIVTIRNRVGLVNWGWGLHTQNLTIYQSFLFKFKIFFI